MMRELDEMLEMNTSVELSDFFRLVCFEVFTCEWVNASIPPRKVLAKKWQDANG